MRLLDFSREVDVKNALEQTWRYCVWEDHLLTVGRETIKLLGLLVVSGGSWLYGALAAQATMNYPQWQKKSHVVGATICGGVVLISATHEYIDLRSGRHMPSRLLTFALPVNKFRKYLKDLAVISVSALASVSLATTAWRYPDWSSKSLQYAWFIYIETVNTALHLLPVELVAFNHPVYSLPLRPFRAAYRFIERCVVSADYLLTQEFFNFKRGIADQLCQKLFSCLDSVIEERINQSFEFNSFSGGIFKWLSYIKKDHAPIDDIFSMPLLDVLYKECKDLPHASVEDSSAWVGWLKQKGKQASYMMGAGMVALSCAGYAVDPPVLLQSLGWSPEEAYLFSAPAIYFFWVLLSHLGGVSAQTDITAIARAILRKQSMPLPAKLHTKAFVIALMANLYTAIFSYKAAEKITADHFGESGLLASTLKWCARIGIGYLSWGSMKAFYERYLITGVRLNPYDINRTAAQAQARVAYYKRCVSSISPDELVAAFKKYPKEAIPQILGMSFEEFVRMSDFESRFEEYQKRPGCSEWLRNKCNLFSRRQPQDDLEAPLLINASLSS